MIVPEALGKRALRCTYCPHVTSLMNKLETHISNTLNSFTLFLYQCSDCQSVSDTHRKASNALKVTPETWKQKAER